MNTIKTVVFDLGGVLVDLDIDRCTGAFRSLGMDAVADLINPYYPAEMIGRLEHGIISFHEACDEMRRLSGTPEVTDAQIAWAYGQFLVRIPVAKLRQIDALRERGIRTCVLSNNNPASMKYIRRMFTADGKTMDDYFDAVFLSYELHELKPSEAIFRKMIAAGGMRPEETLFIDDGQKNVDARAETRIRGLHARSGGGFRPHTRQSQPLRRDPVKSRRPTDAARRRGRFAREEKPRRKTRPRTCRGRLGRPPTARVRRRTQRKPRRRQGAHHPRHTQKPRRQPKARRSGKDRNKTKQPLRSQDRRGFLISYIVCRSDRIRTCDPLVPNQIRYRDCATLRTPRLPPEFQ